MLQVLSSEHAKSNTKEHENMNVCSQISVDWSGLQNNH